MDTPPTRRGTAVVSLGLVLGLTLGTLVLSLLIRQPCASGNWDDGRQYRRLCYSDMIPLFGTEHLQGNRLPYLNACPEDAGSQCDEYPVVTMYVMRVAAWVSTNYGAFFYANATLLMLCGLFVAWALYRMVGSRALYFALAPSLLVYGFVNWDLLAIALATGATLAFFRRRDAQAGILIGLGAAAKLYPALLLVPFALDRLRHRHPEGAATLAVWSSITYVAVNLPFAMAGPGPWATFFRFNAERPVDWDSLWFVACSEITGSSSCGWSIRTINVLSLVAFLGLSALVWMVARSRRPDFPRWTFVFPLLVLFLLSNKVYSPQYSLWLLPMFALALPNPWLFGAFSVADVAVFLTRFTWFGRLAAEGGDPAFAGFDGSPIGAFEITIVVRAAILLFCVGWWVWGLKGPPGPHRDVVEETERAEAPRPSEVAA